ncbi:hypothetical protein FOA43_003479 [Brettanomyces nanus]|uniref:Pre-mRNA-splicing factor SLU7 n=1 Tax=Eeniella nana TaxID=13502 RepID=A0A875S594_EENNA|nr:uncharacterized protein FOA43_003479 [Brettanomyces nanus]QPG76093.1 hypothetical protein FOA43_003479 [Brettanomyces nanus]
MSFEDHSKKPRYDASGNKINDYIPYYISKKPWYYESEALKNNSNIRKRNAEEERIAMTTEERFKHQRKDMEADLAPNDEPRKGEGIKEEFEKVEVKRSIRSVRQKSVCGNCGSSNHATKDCLDRPRRVKYRYRTHSKSEDTSNRHDGYLVRKETNNYDEKRDRWHGFDVDSEYDEQVKKMKQKEKNMRNKMTTDVDLEELDNDELEEMKELGLIDDIKKAKKDATLKAVIENNPLAAEKNTRASVRSLDEKPRYLEVIDSGEELRFNPKSRVYKDLKEGYLNSRGQFIPYLNGEAADFEKMKQFTHGIQQQRKEKWENGEKDVTSMADLTYTEEASPTAVMLATKKKKLELDEVREAKRRQLLAKYGALGIEKKD